MSNNSPGFHGETSGTGTMMAGRPATPKQPDSYLRIFQRFLDGDLTDGYQPDASRMSTGKQAKQLRRELAAQGYYLSKGQIKDLRKYGKASVERANAQAKIAALDPTDPEYEKKKAKLTPSTKDSKKYNRREARVANIYNRLRDQTAVPVYDKEGNDGKVIKYLYEGDEGYEDAARVHLNDQHYVAPVKPKTAQDWAKDDPAKMNDWAKRTFYANYRNDAYSPLKLDWYTQGLDSKGKVLPNYNMVVKENEYFAGLTPLEKQAYLHARSQGTALTPRGDLAAVPYNEALEYYFGGADDERMQEFMRPMQKFYDYAAFGDTPPEGIEFDSNTPWKDEYIGAHMEDPLAAEKLRSKGVYGQVTTPMIYDPTTHKVIYEQTGGTLDKSNEQLQEQVIALTQQAIAGDQQAQAAIKQIIDAAQSGSQEAKGVAQLVITLIEQSKQESQNMPQMYQQGGAAPQAAGSEQDMQTKIIQLVQAAMSGDEQATQTIQQIMEAAKQGDQQAMQIAQMIQAVAEQMQSQAQSGATMAKLGSKLNYFRSLSTGCPAGTEPQYFKKGGHVCKACVKKAKKAQEGAEVPEERCGGKTARKHLAGGYLKYFKDGGPAKSNHSRQNSAPQGSYANPKRLPEVVETPGFREDDPRYLPEVTVRPQASSSWRESIPVIGPLSRGNFGGAALDLIGVAPIANPVIKSKSILGQQLKPATRILR